MATQTREQYSKHEKWLEATPAAKEPEGTAARPKARETGLTSRAADMVRRGFLDLQLFLSSFLPPYTAAFRHPRSLSAKEKAEREMDLMGFYNI